MMAMLLFVFTFSVVYFSPISATMINGDVFATELNRVADAVGMRFMQSEYDKMTYKDRPVSGQSIVNEIAQSLSGQFLAMKEALSAIRQKLEGSSYTSTYTMTKCCNEKDMPMDIRFSANVSFDRGCLAISGSATSSKQFPDESVVNVMKDNYKKNPSLLWQYFGSRDGILLNFPASNLSNCHTYDPRFRQFFVSTASPVAKDVVLLFDTSESMKEKHSLQDKQLIQIAKEATSIVLDTLSPHDRVGAVAFSDEVSTPNTEDCYKNLLARATRVNIANIRQFVNNRGTSGRSNYEKAFTAAFKYFTDSSYSIQNEERDRIILFLTSGTSYIANNVLEVIRTQNQVLNNSVIIHAFQLGSGRSDESKALLKNMTEQTRTGVFKNITDKEQLNTVMGEYYLYSSQSLKNEPVFSEPFLDIFSRKGLLMAMCLPVNIGVTFKGVVCTDFRLNELLSKVTYLQEGDNTYAFAIDGSGRTLVHPLLPQRRERTDNPEVVDIENFEMSKDADAIIKSMKNGEDGSKNGIATKQTISRGTFLQEGDTHRTMLANYYWKKVENSNISLCIVIGAHVTSLKELTNVPKFNGDFYYHNRQERNYSATPCKHYARWATTDHSCVMMAPSSFTQPLKYLYDPETQGKILKYEQYFKGEITTNPGVLDTIQNTVAITYLLESFWKKSIEEAKFVIWRYICTQDGITRMYPCVQLTKDYDPTLRPWYQRTITRPLKNVLSPPYVDAWGSGLLISLTRTIYQGRSNGVHRVNDTIMGVIGTDFPISYFNQLIQTKYKICTEKSFSCIIIDDSGFLVMHPDFVDVREDPGLTKSFHIGSKEGLIAEDLISQGIMYRESCLDTEHHKDQYTYRISYPIKYSSGMDRMDEVGYQITPIPDSVISIILKKNSVSNSVCCASPNLGPTVKNCVSGDNKNCDCLCYKDVAFNNCQNKYTDGSRSPACSARPQELLSISPNESIQTEGLPFCFPIDCCSKSSKHDCYNVAGCAWCEETKAESLLTRPFCHEQFTCPFRRCIDDKCQPKCSTGTEPPLSDKPVQSSQTVTIVAVVCGSVVAVIVTAIIIAKLALRKPSNARQDYIDAIDVDRTDRVVFDNVGHTNDSTTEPIPSVDYQCIPSGNKLHAENFDRYITTD